MINTDKIASHYLSNSIGEDNFDEAILVHNIQVISSTRVVGLIAYSIGDCGKYPTILVSSKEALVYAGPAAAILRKHSHKPQ